MIILASGSPRRAELLRNAGIAFEVQVANIPEEHQPGERAADYVQRLARGKAMKVLQQNPEAVVLGADTTVVLDEYIALQSELPEGARETLLEKPRDVEEAKQMLHLLSGREHRVLTGVCLAWHGGAGPGCDVRVETTLVRFADLTEREIEEYVASGEPMDKAGAYGIQGRASKFVTGVIGCYFNVMGLPVQLVYRMLEGRA